MDLLASGFRGAARRMQSADLVAVAKLGGYEVTALQAVMEVEAAGAGFDAAGRPKLLPERHVFFRELWDGKMLQPGWQAKQARQSDAVRSGLAYLKWGMQPYPATSDGCYALLARMMAVDPIAALRACSWGLGQVMGFNAAACGYPDVRDMVVACMESEIAQFRCMLGYIETKKLGPALKSKDWRAFARGYNGSGQVDAYAGKLAAAYSRRLGAAGKPVAVAPGPALSDTDRLNDASLAAARSG